MVHRSLQAQFYMLLGGNYVPAVFCIPFATYGGDLLLRLQNFNLLEYFEVKLGSGARLRPCFMRTLTLLVGTKFTPRKMSSEMRPSPRSNNLGLLTFWGGSEQWQGVTPGRDGCSLPKLARIAFTLKTTQG